MGKQNTKKEYSFKINEYIYHRGPVRIIGDNIESKVITMERAREMANSMNMDLVEINGNLEIPIIKICQYDKFLYELKKNEKKNKQSALPVKEIQLSVNIATNDLSTKANQANKFLDKGHKVKVVLSMRGRELSRRDDNKKVLLDFIEMVGELALVESMKDEGNRTIVILKHKK